MSYEEAMKQEALLLLNEVHMGKKSLNAIKARAEQALDNMRVAGKATRTLTEHLRAVSRARTRSSAIAHADEAIDYIETRVNPRRKKAAAKRKRNPRYGPRTQDYRWNQKARGQDFGIFQDHNRIFVGKNGRVADAPGWYIAKKTYRSREAARAAARRLHEGGEKALVRFINTNLTSKNFYWPGEEPPKKPMTDAEKARMRRGLDRLSKSLGRGLLRKNPRLSEEMKSVRKRIQKCKTYASCQALEKSLIRLYNAGILSESDLEKADHWLFVHRHENDLITKPTKKNPSVANTVTIKMDRNGNKVAALKTPHGGFSIQTSGNLPRTHRFGKGALKTKEQYKTALYELLAYVSAFGTARQKEIMVKLAGSGAGIDRY